MDLFKEQPSNNRVDLLNFLSTKPNIKIMNDKEGQTLKNWINKTKKRVKWEPDVVIYYFLSRQEKWTKITIPDFNKTASNLPRYMIFEDSHYYETVIPLYKKYKFNLLLKPQKKKVLDDHYKKKGINIEIIHDYSSYENQNKFLEGTGSVVLNRKNNIAYCALSNRSNKELFMKFCNDLNYSPVLFNSIYESKPIYHTNVLMSICNNFSIICLESVENQDEKNNLIRSLEDSELDIIDISYDQMRCYLGNCIQLVDKDLNPKLVMSTSAFKSIKSNQLSRILKHTEIIHSDIKTIENYGGGSARCMIAEIF